MCAKDENSGARAHRAEPRRFTDADLAVVIVSATIDFITVETTGRASLPLTDGKVFWSRRHHNKRMSIHDPSALDLLRIRSVLGMVPVLEMEVSVDIRARPRFNGELRLPFIQTLLVELFGRQLDPTRAEHSLEESRRLYRPKANGSGRIRPFNTNLPQASDQQLHGWRTDVCQVKAYAKIRDQGRALEPEKYSARVEVRLASSGLSRRGLSTIEDVFGFKFRKNLMPFFTLVKGTRRSASGLEPVHLKDLDATDQALWAKAGVGAFKRGGRGNPEGLRLVRNRRVNARIGQALHRLEKKFCAEEFVRLRDRHSAVQPSATRDPAQSMSFSYNCQRPDRQHHHDSEASPYEPIDCGNLAAVDD
jgi:hypothetical protein